jgi:uncharacterized protein (TIGR02246 family)
MPRFSRLFEAAAESLSAFYQAVTDGSVDNMMSLWIDEDFASFINAEGMHWHGLESIRAGFAAQLEAGALPASIEPLDVRVYDSLGTIVYAIAEMHQPADPLDAPRMVFTTYVMVHERGEWRIAHIHASPMPEETATHFAAKLRHEQGPLH